VPNGCGDAPRTLAADARDYEASGMRKGELAVEVAQPRGSASSICANKLAAASSDQRLRLF